MFSFITWGFISCLFGCSKTNAQPINTSHYEVVHSWPQLPEGRKLGAVSGVAVDSHNNVFVFHRAGRLWPSDNVLIMDAIEEPTITIFDGKSGALIHQWGANTFAMPHGLTIDQNDNVWVTDLAYQQIYKFSHDGHLLLTLGERGVAGDDAKHFNRPTAVAVTHDGSFYVSDGYRNNRIMKFSATGEFLFQWGKKGDNAGEFNLPHGVTLDKSGHVYVSDRSNSRVQVFDADGKYIREWKSDTIGRPYAVAIKDDGDALVVDGGDQPLAPPHRSGVTAIHSDGSVDHRFGRYGNYDGQFDMAHDVAISKDGSVYIGDINGSRIQKFVRK